MPIGGVDAQLCPCGIATTTPWTFTVASDRSLSIPARSSCPEPEQCAPQSSPYPVRKTSRSAPPSRAAALQRLNCQGLSDHRHGCVILAGGGCVYREIYTTFDLEQALANLGIALTKKEKRVPPAGHIVRR